jgi:hypothetical protein
MVVMSVVTLRGLSRALAARRLRLLRLRLLKLGFEGTELGGRVCGCGLLGLRLNGLLECVASG